MYDWSISIQKNPYDPGYALVVDTSRLPGLPVVYLLDGNYKALAHGAWNGVNGIAAINLETGATPPYDNNGHGPITGIHDVMVALRNSDGSTIATGMAGDKHDTSLVQTFMSPTAVSVHDPVVGSLQEIRMPTLSQPVVNAITRQVEVIVGNDRDMPLQGALILRVSHPGEAYPAGTIMNAEVPARSTRLFVFSPVLATGAWQYEIRLLENNALLAITSASATVGVVDPIVGNNAGTTTQPSETVTLPTSTTITPIVAATTDPVIGNAITGGSSVTGVIPAVISGVHHVSHHGFGLLALTGVAGVLWWLHQRDS